MMRSLAKKGDDMKDMGFIEDPEAEVVEAESLCPTCDGPAMKMGSLGRLTWFRCRNCGTEFNQKAQG